MLLVNELITDPSSHLTAALAGWSRSWPTEAWVLADVADVLIRAHSRKGTKPKAYPRPNDKERKHKRLGRVTVPADKVAAALSARGHTRG